MEHEATPPAGQHRQYSVGSWQHRLQSTINELKDAIEMGDTWGERSDRVKRAIENARYSIVMVRGELARSRRLHREMERDRKRREARERNDEYERQHKAREELMRRGVEIPIDRTGYFRPSDILDRIQREEAARTGTDS